MGRAVKHAGRIWPLIAAGWIALGVGWAAAQTIPGEKEYKNNCAVCHGPTGKGDGEAVYVLRGMKPPDLTQLSRQNGGHFPQQKVYQVVGGHDDVPAHHLGEGRMPTWGGSAQLSEGLPNPTGEAGARQRMTDIARFLETLQEK